MNLSSSSPDSVLPGLDALRAGHLPEILSFLRGKRVGLLTNHTGRARDGQTTLEVLRELGLDVRTLFSPEHGIEGKREGHIESDKTADDLPIYSLYGETRRPTAEMLENVEVFVCDLQDVGARFYTYASTLAHCMEECAARGIAVVVLDRPNPAGGRIIEGPSIDKDAQSFIGYLDIPIRHGMTMGELALLFKSDKSLSLDLHIAKISNWRRDMLWPQTGLEWRVPSPNLPDFESAIWYPGLCLLEFSKVSVGRGTEAPFQILGAPWMDTPKLLDALQAEPAFTENFQAEAIEFNPTRATHEGVLCQGLKFSLKNPSFENQKFVPLGLVLLSVLYRTQPEHFDEEKMQRSLILLGSAGVLQLLREGEIEAAIEITERDAEIFRTRRKPFLLKES